MADVVLAQPPRLRILQLSADGLSCLVERFHWHASVTLHLDPRDNSVVHPEVATEDRTFESAKTDIEFAFLEFPP